MQLQVQQVAEPEVLVDLELYASLLHQLLPVPLAHRGVAQVCDERDCLLEAFQNCIQLPVAVERLRQRVHLHLLLAQLADCVGQRLGINVLE